MRIAICDDEREIRELYAEKLRQLYPCADLVRYQSGEVSSGKWSWHHIF